MKVYKIGEYREKTIIADIDFKEIQLHKTYDRNGQQVDPYEVAVMTILTQKAADLANNTPTFTKKARVEIGDPIYCTDQRFYELRCEVEEGVDYSLESETVIAYNYWDENNWKTIVLEHPFGHYPDIELCSLEETEPLLAEFETKEFSHSGFGTETFTSENYLFVRNQFASSWEDYEVIIK